jgi:hypothetical protein
MFCGDEPLQVEALQPQGWTALEKSYMEFLWMYGELLIVTYSKHKMHN